MNETPDNKKQPLIDAFITLVVLLASVFFVSASTDFSGVDLRGLLFVSVVISCALIAKSVYDSALNVAEVAAKEKDLKENLLVASRELYTELYEKSPVPYLLIDNAGVVRSGNLASKRIFGVTSKDIKGMSVFEQLSCDESQHLDLIIEKYRNGISLSDELVKVKRNNGSEAWALLSLFRFKSNDELLGLLTLVDITKQKQVENAKSEFVSLASHQLRTPIAGIKWSAELLQLDSTGVLSEQQKKYIDRLLIATKRMAVLVDDFLRVSRFELGTFQAVYQSVNLTDLMNDVIAEQSPRVQQKQLIIETFFDKTSEQIVTDADLVRMITSNLFSNAVKYTKEGGTIHIGFGKKNDDIAISIADNGMGIPTHDQERIFSKLFRASNAARLVPDGTGLGLYIVKAAVEVLGGKVSFQSIENTGTTFDVVIPSESLSRIKR